MIEKIEDIILTNSGEINSFSDLKLKFKNIHHFPMISINFLKYDLDLKEFDYVIFCSKNAVKSLMQNINNDDIHENLNCISIGSKTAKLLDQFGLKNFMTSKKSYSQKMLDDIKKIKGLSESKVLLMQGSLSSDMLYNSLKKITTVRRIKSYQTIKKEKKIFELENLLTNRKTITVFTSPSCFDAFCLNYNPKNTKIISIGKTTSEHIASKNYKIDLTSRMQTFEKISEEILKKY